MFSKTLGTVLMVLFLSGCSSKSLDVVHVDRNSLDAIVNDNSADVSFIKEKANAEKVCAYRDADAQNVSHQGIEATVNGKGIAETSGSNALSLGGRSPAVLIIRELMYRACELTLNTNSDQNSSIEIYKMFLNFSNDIIKNEHDQGSQSTSIASQDKLPALDISKKNLNSESNEENTDTTSDETQSDQSNSQDDNSSSNTGW